MASADEMGNAHLVPPSGRASRLDLLGDLDLGLDVAGGVLAMTQRTGTPTIRFDATLHTIDNWTILRLPEKASRKLQSRGQVAVQGTINGHGFQTVLEPDGYLGHWMRIDGELQQNAALSAGDTATLEIESLKDWPEPNVPQDLMQLWQLPLRRSEPYGKKLRRWRAGNGCAGSMQPKTLKRANDGSK